MAGGGLQERLNAVTTFPRGAATSQGALSLTRAQFFLFLAGYFGLHVIARGIVSETAGIDDVDQILRAQLWSWGYGPQPPLYTWLTKIFLGMFGYNVFSLLLLKESVIFAIYALVFANTRLLTGSKTCAFAAAALLQFLPSIAWESHRELTHTVLASAMVLATLYSFLRLDPSRWRTYFLFGVCGGLGMLAKYNFAIVYLALLLAAFCVRDLRPVVANRKMLIAVLLTFLICAPNAHWMLQHKELALSSVHKLKIVQTPTWWVPAAAGLSRLTVVIIAHVGLLLGFAAWVFRADLRRVRLTSPREKLLWRMLLWILVIVALAIAGFKVTGPRDRYVQPLFVWLPILLLSLFREKMTRGRLTTILGCGATIAVVVLVVSPTRILLTEWLNKHEVLTIPFRKLAADLSPALDPVDCIIAEDHALAGNLRLRFPNKILIDPEVGPLFAPVPGTTMLVWDAGKSADPPADLMRFARSFTRKEALTNRGSVEELLKYHRQRTIRLGTASIP